MKTILVIDENRVMRENTAEILELSNYNVLSEENLNKGLEVALDRHPDMIIFDDITMKVKGPDLLNSFRQAAGLENTPFILLTDSDEGNNRNKGPETRPEGILSKPFEVEELLHLVARYLVKSE